LQELRHAKTGVECRMGAHLKAKSKKKKKEKEEKEEIKD